MHKQINGTWSQLAEGLIKHRAAMVTIINGLEFFPADEVVLKRIREITRLPSSQNIRITRTFVGHDVSIGLYLDNIQDNESALGLLRGDE